jgi:uncharacterized protein
LDKIIGRVQEQKELEDAYHSSEAELIAIFGRRRVGKTYLIRNFFIAKKCIYFHTACIYKGSLQAQLTQFSKELGETFYQGVAIKTPGTWLEAFEILTIAISKVNKNKKVVVFLDELPWMATKKSGVISALEYYWNRHWVNDNRIKLVVCGSAASWIIKKIIKNRGGLHNRVTRKIKLLPFNLHETYSFLKKQGYQCNFQQTCKLYMIIGGVPFYLKCIKQNYSVDQNINKLFFDPNSLLFDEFEEVFSSLFDHSEQYKELITLIASYQDGVSRTVLEGNSKLTSNGGRLSSRLEDLENTGFITSYISYGHKRQGLFYRISDEYCNFYIKWIEPIKIFIKQDHMGKYWKKIVNTPAYFNWMGYTFENICYKHIPQIKRVLELEDSSLASPWRYVPRNELPERGAQIDLLFDRDDETITICEIKYTETPFLIDKQYHDKLTQKINVFKKVTRTNKQIFIAFISASGIKKNLYSEALVNQLVVLEDLFKNL